MTKRDYYEILGVSKNASDDEIKKAYHKAAIKSHPDKEGGSEEKFKEVNEAYEVLKDGEKRRRYDQFGHAGVGGNSGGGASGGNPFGGGFGGFNGQEVHFDFGDGGLGDIFGQFFGGGNTRGSGYEQPRRGKDVEVALELSFEEAVFGLEKKVRLEMNDECSHCHGTTVEPGYEMKTCPECKGVGQINQVMNTIFGPIQQNVTCPNCKGRGKIPEKVCSVCRGKGVERRARDINLKIPAGIDDGATIRLRGYGEAIGGGSKGDLYVHIQVKAHKQFTREGDIILSEAHVGMIEAALGTEINIDTIDGEIRMKVPAGTQSGTDFKLSGHGVPHGPSGRRGPHIVNLIVDTPTRLSRKQKKILEEF